MVENIIQIKSGIAIKSLCGIQNLIKNHLSKKITFGVLAHVLQKIADYVTACDESVVATKTSLAQTVPTKSI